MTRVKLLFSLFYGSLLHTKLVSSLCSISSVNIGIFGEKFTNIGTLNVKGSQTVSAMLMAIREINNKTDGINDHLLPDTHIRFALRETKADYLRASLAAQDFSLKVFNGSGVVGAIGTGYDKASKAVAATFANTNYLVNMIDYYANDSILSHSSSYPYFRRVVPSGGYDGRILAHVAEHYGWTRVNVFSTSDTYGTDTSLEFFLEAEEIGIQIENKHSFWPGTDTSDHHFQEMIKKTKEWGVLKVFVLIMKSNDAGILLEAGYKAGLFKTGTQIIGTEYILHPEVWQHMTPEAPVADIMNGIISVTPVMNRNTDEFRSFVSRYVAQSNTKTIDADGTITCSQEKDDDGGTYLYLDENQDPNAAVGCSGIDYSSLNPSGSDLDDPVPYAYDAVTALALGLHAVIHDHNNCDFTGDDLRKVLNDEVKFTGATGYIEFFAGLGGIEAYGSGDRQVGLTYRVMNFNPILFHRYAEHQLQAIRTIGYWNTDDKLWVECDMLRDSYCTIPAFNTWDGKLVDDTPTVVEIELEYWAQNLLRVGAVLAMLTALMYLFIIVLYMDTRLIKASQPSVMIVVIFGTMLGSVMIFFKTMHHSDEICIASMWFAHLSFAFVFSALLFKTWRVGKIVNSRFSRIKVTPALMFKLFSAAILLFCIFLLINSVVGNPHKSYEQYFDGHQNIQLMKCESDNPYIAWGIFFLEDYILFYCAKLCYDAKDAPNSVNDSTSISIAIYLIGFVCAVAFPIVFLHVDPTPQNMTLVMSVGFIVAMVGVSHILFFHKTILAIEGADVDGNFNIVRENESSRMSSSGLASNFIRKLQSRAINASHMVNSSRTDNPPSMIAPLSSRANVQTARKNYPSVNKMESVYEVPDNEDDSKSPENNNNTVHSSMKAKLLHAESGSTKHKLNNKETSPCLKKSDEIRSEVRSLCNHSLVSEELET